MKRVQILLFAGLLLLAVVIVLLALRFRQPPLLPDDAEHASFVSGPRCAVCHGPDGELPRTKNHPSGEDCVRCHGR